MAAKYIFVTGGVVSSLGKGITAASLGRILKSRGYKVAIQKFDPYINVDAGMMSPLQHGEVYVTGDGGECDLDIGHYERFIDENLTFDNNVSAGRIYWSIITREQKGGFDGGTVQVIPHITGEIKRRALLAGRNDGADIVITEIGGTVGDIESLPHIEAIRQIKAEIGSENCLFIHVTLVPYLSATHELKTKPTQHSVKALLSLGIQPNIIVCRTERELDAETREKIGLFCNIDAKHVVQNLDAKTLYEIPLMLEDEGLGDLVCQQLALERSVSDLDEWREMVRLHKNPQSRVEIALVGKYVQLKDAYISVTEALVHGGIGKQIGVDIRWLDAEKLDKYEAMSEALEGVHGIIVPGGFGHRGMRGKMLAARYAREHDIPFFGIGLGMQMAAVDVARNVLGFEGAHTNEAQSDTLTLVTVSGSHHKETKGIIRLGNYRCDIKPGTLASRVYGQEQVDERHRHRHEINPALESAFEEHGLIVSGKAAEGGEIEIMEMKGHTWYMIVSFHPEFRSRPNRPHPIFKSFIEVCSERVLNQSITT